MIMRTSTASIILLLIRVAVRRSQAEGRRLVELCFLLDERLQGALVLDTEAWIYQGELVDSRLQMRPQLSAEQLEVIRHAQMEFVSWRTRDQCTDR